jgi:hypothetical protein
MSNTCIVKICNSSWEQEFIAGVKNKNNCSGFIKSVAKSLNIPLPQLQADGILESIENSWETLSSGSDAAKKAAAGFFVLAGLKSKDHSKKVTQGHVVIVIDGALYRATYPKCWGGSTGTAQSKGDKSVGEVWNTVDRNKVVYYFYKHQVCLD